jgi:hypothetical protein
MSHERKGSARRYREAAEAYLGGRKVEAAGVFQRPSWLSPGHETEGSFRGLEALEERLTHGRLGPLPTSFLLAVTKDKVHAFTYGGEGQDFQVREEIAVFDRDEVRMRSIAGGEVVQLSGMEKGRTRQIDLDGEVVKKSPGATEVLAALLE